MQRLTFEPASGLPPPPAAVRDPAGGLGRAQRARREGQPPSAAVATLAPVAAPERARTSLPVRDDSPRRRWVDGRGIDAAMAARNRRLVDAAKVELVERGGRTYELRRLLDVSPPDPRLEPRPVAPRVNSFPPLA